MKKATIDFDNCVKAIIWQEDEETGIGEPAIAVKYWSRSGPAVEIKQGANEVILNIDTIPALIKALRLLHREVRK